MKPLPRSQREVQRSLFKVTPLAMPGLGGMLLSFLLISRDTLALRWPDFPGITITEASMVGWSLFWFIAFVLGGIMGTLLYPLFRFQSPLAASELDPRRHKILLIGSGILTALILVTLYLLTQRTLAALTTLPGSAQFVVEVRNDLSQKAACSNQPLITPSEVRGSLGEPVILKLTPAGVKQSIQASPLHRQPGQVARLPFGFGQQTAQMACSQCHSPDLKTSEALTFVVSWSALETEARPASQGHLEVTY